jgi:hypothetical protein
MLFGGVPNVPGPEVFAKVQEGWAPEVKAFRAAYEQFARDPRSKGLYPDLGGKGATIEQIWNYMTIFGVEPYCFLARPMPADQIQGIRRLEQCSPQELIKSLARLGGYYAKMSVVTLIYDGSFGHCIYLKAHAPDRDRFIYFDPWPARSLLCEENNSAGVAAQPESPPGGALGHIDRWSVTSAELASVIVASMLRPADWARLREINFNIYYDQWKDSDFFKFFHIRMLDEKTDGSITQRTFTAGPFKGPVTLVVRSIGNGQICSAKLSMEKNWFVQHILMALDLSRSFVLAFSPPPDRACYSELCESMSKFTDPSVHDSVSQQKYSLALQAFIGMREKGDIITDFATLWIANTVQEEQAFLELGFELA